MEKKWNIYRNWCKQEGLDPYNMAHLARFESGRVFEDEYGQIVLEEDVEVHYSDRLGGYVDLHGTRPLIPLDVLCE